ncbi:MAG: HAD family hydrolase [Clostridiales bacterium]|nr:HAD family hydrolase [Candidatus Blautia equi]
MKEKKFDGVIFDVDGTLWNSTDIVAAAWTEYLKNEEHIDIEVTSERLQSLFGKLLSDIAAVIFADYPKEEQLRLVDACCEAEHRALEKECAPLYEDLEEALKQLSARYTLFIVSNCEAGYIETFLKATGFDPYFTGHLCPGDTGNAKAENILQVVRENDLKAPIYVGDTLGDFNACEKAGVPFIFASYGFGRVENPYAVIRKPMDLLDIL